MKILRVRGKNLASLYGEFELPLDRAPISESGLFSISGPTGAGKSTIVDALCLALYGRTSRLGARSRNVRIGSADADDLIDADDERTIMSFGTSEARAEVEFEGMDGKTYRAEWSVHRARGNAAGRFQAVKRALVDLTDGQPLAARTAEVDAEVARRIGFKFEEFQRAVVLPQFQFRAFLDARPDERSAILERVTGTDIYTRLSKVAYERSAEAERKLSETEARLGDAKLLSPEERRELEMSCQAQEARREASRVATKQAGTIVRWHETSTKLDAEKAEAEGLLMTATTAQRAAAPEREKLARVVEVERLRPVYTDAVRSEEARAEAETLVSKAAAAHATAREAHADAEKRAVNAVQNASDAAATLEKAGPELTRARALDIQVAEASKRAQAAADAAKAANQVFADATRVASESDRSLKHAQRTFKLAEDWLQGHKSEQPLAREWPRWQARLLEYGQVAQNLASREMALKTISEKERAANRKKAQLVEKLAGLANDLKKASAAKVKADAILADFDVKALKRRASEATMRNKALTELLRYAEEATQAKTDRDEAHDKIGVAAEQVCDFQKRKEELEKEAARAEGAEEAAARSLRLCEAALTLEDRRGELEVGQPCPLCGALKHPYATEAPGRSVILEQKKALVKVQSERKRLQKEETAATAALASARQSEKDARASEEKHATAVERAAEKYKKARDKHELPRVPAKAETGVAHLAEMCAEAEQEETVANQKVEKGDEAARKLEQARQNEETVRKAIVEVEKEHHEAERSADALTKDVERIRGELHGFEGRRDGMESDLEPVLDFIENWHRALRADPKEFTKRCAGVALSHADHEAERSSAAAEIVGLTNLSQSGNAVLEEKRGLVAVEEQRVTAETAALNERRSERVQIFGGRDANEVERDLRATIRAAESTAKEAQGALDTAGKSLAAAEQELRSATTQLEQSRRKEGAAGSELVEALHMVELGRIEVEQLLAHGADWIIGEQQRLGQIDRVVNEAESRLNDRRTRAEEHGRTDRPDIGLEEAKRHLQDAEADEQQAQNDLMEAQVRLRQDDENRQRHQHLAAEVEQQRALRNRWRSLSEVIGSSDGKKFRVFAQGLALDALLVAANYHLEELARRYQLERAPGADLEIQLVDRDLGNEIRGTNSLSGGESFLVSLALALGLASLSTKMTHARTLFIDEGFGTLDRNTLEHAMAALESLRATGRTIGVISHVPELHERFGVQVTVERVSATRSRVILPT
jgi:DNA repair protein SbcC/Rad50